MIVTVTTEDIEAARSRDNGSTGLDVALQLLDDTIDRRFFGNVRVWIWNRALCLEEAYDIDPMSLTEEGFGVPFDAVLHRVPEADRRAPKRTAWRGLERSGLLAFHGRG